MKYILLGIAVILFGGLSLPLLDVVGFFITIIGLVICIVGTIFCKNK